MMDIPEPQWPNDIDSAVRVQRQLRDKVRLSDKLVSPATAAGVDVAYDIDTDQLVAAAVVLDVNTCEVVDSATSYGRATFPYRPGFLAFRELPIVLAVLRQLKTAPGVVICDGHGLAHPRHFGLACHLGVLIDVPTMGVAKNPPQFPVGPVGADRGSSTIIRDGNDPVGIALRTQDGIKPVYVSVGHRIGLTEARDLVLRLTPEYRQPETTRAADRLGRRELASIRAVGLQ